LTSSWKIGAGSGLIAGIVFGIIYEIFNQIAVSLGLFEIYWREITINNVVVNIPLFGFWGLVLGIIYSKVYNIIPKKSIFKGLIYGLFLYFIIPFRIETFDIAYGLYLDVFGVNFSGFFSWLSYGLILGILYDHLSKRYYPTKEELKIITYPMKSGILPGAIAGFSGGMAASISQVIGHATGYWGIPTTEGVIISTMDFWLSQVGTHILINMIWGTVFGAFFALVYNLVPGKKVNKGLCYGLIIFLITTFLIGTNIVIWPIFHNKWVVATFYAGAAWITGGAQFLIFGIVLGLFYRKPSD
jgi:hypothetical protein